MRSVKGCVDGYVLHGMIVCVPPAPQPIKGIERVRTRVRSYATYSQMEMPTIILLSC